MKLALTRTPEP